MIDQVACKLWILFVLDEKTLSILNLTSVKVLELRVLRLHKILIKTCPRFEKSSTNCTSSRKTLVCAYSQCHEFAYV